jgi:hypothetical protein
MWNEVRCGIKWIENKTVPVRNIQGVGLCFGPARSEAKTQ